MNRKTFTALAALALLAVLVAAYLMFRPQTETDSAAPAASSDYPIDAVTAAPAVAEPTSGPASAVLASEPASAAASDAPPLPALDQANSAVKDALIDLLSTPAVLNHLQTDGFVRRAVASVDNLTRSHAPSRIWPVNPMAGKFSVNDDGSIAATNAQRYEAWVATIERIDPAAAAALYRRLYPLLQQAYGELGFPNQRFHVRLVEVIDHLLATPTPASSPKLVLTEVKGPIASERPWVRYEFADPELQLLSSGQKIMLRVGESHQRRLRDWLGQFRAQIVR